MTLRIPNLDKVTITDPQIGEGLKAVQDYTNKNVTPVAGNRKHPPHLSGLPSINPTLGHI